jgi:hypothetical protein
MTYLELVNDVLLGCVNISFYCFETSYSTLIGKFVNDAKRQIEDAFAWNVLGQTITVTTASSTPAYSLTGAGQKFQVMDVINTTSNVGLTNIELCGHEPQAKLLLHLSIQYLQNLPLMVLMVATTLR